MEKGILTSEQEKKVAELIDDAIKAKGILEVVDGYAARILVSQIDNSLIDKINIDEDLKVQIQELVDAAIEKDWDTVEDLSSEIINELVDVPGIDEDTELLLFSSAIKFIVAAIKQKAQKEKSESGPPAPGHP